MPSTIITKNGSGAPLAADLVAGELAVDLTNGRLYTEDSGGSVIEIGLKPSGKVLIGDTASQTDDLFQIETPASGGGHGIQIRRNDANGDQTIGTISFGNNTDTDLARISAKTDNDGNSGDSGALLFSTQVTSGSLTERLRIDSNGNVGIGVTSPTYRIEAAATSGGSGIKITRGSDSFFEQFQTTTGGVSLAASGSAGFLALRTGTTAGTTTEAMRIDSSGNLSLNSNGSIASLDGVSGMQIGNSTASSAGLALETLNNGYLMYAVGTSLKFWDSTDNTDRITLDGDGNVGIGVSSLVTDSTRRVLQVSTGTDGGQIAFADSTTEAANPRIFATNKSDLKLASANSGASTIQFITGTTTPAERMRIDSSGDIRLTGTAPNAEDSISTVNFYNSSSSLNLASITGKRTAGGTNYGSLIFNTTSAGSIAERMRIDSSGNVGVGVTPSAWSTVTALQVGNAHVGALVDNAYFGANCYYDGSNWRYIATNEASRVELTSGEVQFWNAPSGTAGSVLSQTQAMTLNSSGNLLVGTTALPSSSVEGFCASGTSSGNFTSSGSSTAAYNHWLFYNGNGIVGSISTSGSATTYSTSSDQRLKDNIVDAPSASDDIDAIQVRSFDWKADGSHQKYGMIAQELQTVAPEAVSAPEDPEEMMGVDYSKLVPMMLKEIQSLRARVAQLEGAN